ncbi:hypothetical protein R1sor_018889 [Riccia sorocarpa]|uniref:Uncharacterized protein n=1 Tax=Riccia sorocarpa TaxID=122646 RepID=A0ABD3IDQ8_9MARC
MLASEQVSLKSYAEIKRQTRRVQNIGPLIGRQEVPPERNEHAIDEPVAMTTTEEFRRRIFGHRRLIYSGPRRPPPGLAAANRAAHIGELTEIHERIARDKEASQPEISNRISQAVDSADDEETECSGPDLEEEEE